jgi:hypothetical protein
MFVGGQYGARFFNPLTYGTRHHDPRRIERQEQSRPPGPGAGASLAATPAMTKGDLVELLLANAQLAAAAPRTAPAPVAPRPRPPAPPPTWPQQMAAMQAQLNQLLAINAAQAADLATARAPPPPPCWKPTSWSRTTARACRKRARSAPWTARSPAPSKMRVTIMATESDKEDVKVGVNGHLVQIKRGVPVVIDAAYVEVLRNSTIDTIVEDETASAPCRCNATRSPPSRRNAPWPP